MKKIAEDQGSGLATAKCQSTVNYDAAYYYIKVVKEVFRKESHKYDEFLEILEAYKAQRIDLQSLVDRVKELFKGHRGLLLCFNDFLSKVLEISLPSENDAVDAVSGKKMPKFDDARDFVAKLQNRFRGDRSVYKSFVQCLRLYVSMKKPPEVVCRQLSALVSNYPDLQHELNQFKPAGCQAEASAHNAQKPSDDCEPCTPSYHFIPKDRPLALSSGRTMNDIQVLNNSLEAATSGRENCSFKHMRKNEYEYNLLRCEDDRFELDMLLEIVNATIRRVEILMENIDEVNIPIYLEDYFTAGNIRCIERLYGDHGLEVRDILRDRPYTVLPVILPRLKQKQEEWRRCQTNFNVVWAEVFAKDFHKSLDYRGSYFKEQDMKSLSTKALLAEINKSSGFKRKDEHTVIPQMDFEYPDPNIHDDMYQLIKYSCWQRYKPQDWNKVMNIWTNFLEPLFGVPPRHGTSEDAEDVLHAQNSISNCKSDNRERHVSPSGIKIQRRQQVYVEEPKSEREEGELSPEEEFDEHNFAAYSGSVDREALRNSKDKDSGRQHDMRIDEEENNVSDDSDTATESEYGEEPDEDGNDDFIDNMYESKGIAEETNDGQHVEEPDEDGNDDFIDNMYESKGIAEETNDGQHVEEPDEDGNDDFIDNMYEIKGIAEETNDGQHVEYNGGLRFFYGNDSFYILLRLHHKLYRRLHTAKLCSSSIANNWRTYNDTDSEGRYARFAKALCNLLNGSSDQEKFENDCLTILGAESYLLFTLDQLIIRIVKQMHGIATQEKNSRFIQLYSHESCRKSGRFMDKRYKDNARYLLPEKNIFRLEYVPNAARLSIQLMKPGRN